MNKNYSQDGLSAYIGLLGLVGLGVIIYMMVTGAWLFAYVPW